MTNETKITVVISLVSIGILVGLVAWGTRGNTKSDGSDLQSDIKSAVVAKSADYPIGDLVNDGDFVEGSANAPVTLVEFSDFQCPYCKEAHPQIRALRDQFGLDQLRLVYRYLPIVEIHNQAYPAARAAAAANRQGKFVQFADILFANNTSLNEDFYLKTATDLGLDINQFNADRQTDKTLAWQAYRARDLFQQRGWAISTPTLFINGTKYEGKATTQDLAAAIKPLLTK